MGGVGEEDEIKSSKSKKKRKNDHSQIILDEEPTTKHK